MTHSVFAMLIILILLAFHPQQQVQALSRGSDQDFSYMEVVYNATDLPFSEEYDYVVVGGGTTGCSLAATLSEKHSVLLLERGKPPLSYPSLLAPKLWAENYTILDMVRERFSTEEGVEVSATMILGGSSWIRATPYLRASPEFFASSSDSVKWDMNLVEKAYEWVEMDLVSAPEPLGFWQSAGREAFLEAGIVPDNGFSLEYRLGTQTAGTFDDRFGRRRRADQLLNKGDFSNLQVGVDATVKRIVFSYDESKDGVPKARGVIYTDLYGYSHEAFARREVILSAGALGSPKLMLLSGIGPEPYLFSQHIRTVYAQPSIGNFMSDNPRVSAFIIFQFPLNSSESIQIVGITKDYGVSATSPIVLVSPNPIPFSYFPQNARSVKLRLGIISSYLSQPLSRGTLRLGSPNNISAPPKVRFNYFSDPEDLSNCGKGARKIAEILNTTSISRLKYEDLQGGTGFTFFGVTFPSDYMSGNASFEDYCRNTFATSWNYLGGCVVGKVVDGDFRVIGVNSLRVVDSSAFDTSSGRFPVGFGMMLGRYVGQRILQETKDTDTKY